MAKYLILVLVVLMTILMCSLCKISKDWVFAVLGVILVLDTIDAAAKILKQRERKRP